MARFPRHFKPINSPRYLNDCHEFVFHLTPEGRTPIDRLALGVPYQDKSNIARWGHTGGKDKRCRGNTWFVPYQTIKSRDKQRPHPATFPVQLAVNCIKLHGVSRVQTMLDPFLGIGNSAVAAQECGVPKFIGFEIDEVYLAEAKRRVSAERARGRVILSRADGRRISHRLFAPSSTRTPAALSVRLALDCVSPHAAERSLGRLRGSG